MEEKGQKVVLVFPKIIECLGKIYHTLRDLTLEEHLYSISSNRVGEIKGLASNVKLNSC